MITGTVVVRVDSGIDVIAQCLVTLDQQLVEPGRMDVIVVVHGDDPAVAAGLDAWADGPRRHRLVGPTRGAAVALNGALDAAGGDVVAFVDDSCLLPPTWLRTHLAVHEAVERVGIAGGPVGIHWPGGRPPGIGAEVSGRVSGLDLGDDTVPFPAAEEPVRANMSVRRTVARDAGGFDPWLDVGDPDPLARDTFGLTGRLRDAGWRAVYDPGAAAVAQVVPTSLDPDHLRRRAFADGIVRARVEITRSRRTRARRARRSAGELRAAARAWRHRRTSAAADPVGSLLPVIVHAAASLEFGRLVVRSS